MKIKNQPFDTIDVNVYLNNRISYIIWWILVFLYCQNETVVYPVGVQLLQ
jgi:hypothetical protein